MIARARAPAALFGFGAHFVEEETGDSHPKGRAKTAAGSTSYTT